MNEHSDLPSLEKLEQSIERFAEKDPPKKAEKSADSGWGAAGMRMSLELVCSVVVGAGVGLFLDSRLGTSPFLMVVCLFFGAAGGVMTLLHTAKDLADADVTTEITTDKDKMNT